MDGLSSDCEPQTAEASAVDRIVRQLPQPSRSSCSATENAMVILSIEQTQQSEQNTPIYSRDLEACLSESRSSDRRADGETPVDWSLKHSESSNAGILQLSDILIIFNRAKPDAESSLESQ